METNGEVDDVPSPLSSFSHDTPSPQSHAPTPRGSGNPLRKRGVRCMQCKGCLRKDDCGHCMNCV